MFVLNSENEDTTGDGLSIYKRYKEAFGNIVKAQMKSNPFYELRLYNESGDEMVFQRCFAAGFSGEGPRGTYFVLKDAGFEITEEFIQSLENENFEIAK